MVLTAPAPRPPSGRVAFANSTNSSDVAVATPRQAQLRVMPSANATPPAVPVHASVGSATPTAPAVATPRRQASARPRQEAGHPFVQVAPLHGLSPRNLASAGSGRACSLGEKAFGSPSGIRTSPRNAHILLHAAESVVSSVDSVPPHPSTGMHRSLSGRWLSKDEASPAAELNPTALFPPVPTRTHPPRAKSIGDDIFTRTRQPSAGPKPAFGRTSYGRQGMPNPTERAHQATMDQLKMYSDRLGIPTLEEQVERHFSNYETVYSGGVSDELSAFEARWEAIRAQRAEEEAERLAKEQEALVKATRIQQRLVKSPRVAAISPTAAFRRATSYFTQTLADYSNVSRSGTPEPLPAPTANREHHLTKLMFRRMLLEHNALVDFIMHDLGETEVVRRLNAVNDRYGVRRMNADDFFFLMQEVMAEARITTTVSQLEQRTFDDPRRRSVAAKDVSVMSPQWDDDAPLAQSNALSATVASAAGGGGLLKRVAPPPLAMPHPQYTLRRSDSDLLFTACDWKLIGVVEDDEVEDAIRLLFRPHEQVIASHCKRVLEGRCSVSQMLSVHEAGTMLQAVATVGRHRYGAELDADVRMVMTMLQEVMTSGYVPLVCFRNFTVHGIVLSRALNEMTINAELPTTHIAMPSPDPDRDVAAVQASLQRFDDPRTAHATTAGPGGNNSSQPPSPKIGTAAGSSTSNAFPSSPSSSSPSKAAQQDARDLTHSRFRADLHLAHKAPTDVPEHDVPVWYSNSGLVWMENALHGPLAMTS